MSNFAIKICGVKTPDAVTAAANAGATHIGFNFVKASKRYIAPNKAVILTTVAPASLKRVALFSDPLDHDIADAIDAIQPQILQLHGRETPDRIRFIKKRFGLPIMKAIHVETAEDLSALDAFAPVADEILFDALAPQGEKTTGGHGKPFDWNLLKGVQLAKPWMVSGGLSATNVADAIRITGTRGVDVSSGVESAPGVKDALLIKRFISAARAAFQESQAA